MAGNTVGKRFGEMDDEEFKAAVRTIITTSHSEREVRERLAAMGYTGAVTIDVEDIDSFAALIVSAIESADGGLNLASGEMIVVFLNAPSGALVRF
jgi:hypothetical protein